MMPNLSRESPPFSVDTSERFQPFLVALCAFLVAAPLTLLATTGFNIRTFVVATFLWVLVTSEIFAPPNPENLWWRRLRWVKLIGWIVLVLVIFERVSHLFA